MTCAGILLLALILDAAGVRDGAPAAKEAVESLVETEAGGGALASQMACR